MSGEPVKDQRVLIAVFEDRLSAGKAVDALEQFGFAHDQIGYVIRGADAVQGGMITDAVGAKDIKGAMAGMVTGGMLGGVLAAGISLLIPGVGPIVAGGVLAAFFGGALAGTAVGGIYGALTGLGISEEEARHFEREFHEGRAIVAVKPGARAADVADIFVRFGGRNVHMEASSPVQMGGVFGTP